jgi:Fe-S cluster assembly protein SufD
MSTQTILPVDRAAIENRSKSRNEPEWMTSLRLEALELAGQLEWPKLEKTRIDRWSLDRYGVYKASQEITNLDTLSEQAKALIQEGGHPDNLLIHRNSGSVYQALSEELVKQGVIFTDLETAVREHGDLVQKYFMTAVAKDENRLTALHAALWTGGVFLYVPKNVAIEAPLQALFVTDDAEATFAPHVLVIAEANSSVTYVDNYISEQGEAVNHNSIVEVFVKPGAKVHFASVHNLTAQVTETTYRRAIVENDGRVEWVVAELNDGNCMSDTMSILKGNGSSSDAKIIAIGAGEQKLNYSTRAVHFGKSTPSQMITRAVMRDSATAIINGITKIEKGATGANGEQTERVLMLSPKARGDANPILLIDEDDVKAGHAASVGQVNPEHVHYLMSRGITRVDAERLIILGFLAPVVEEIPLEALRKQLDSLLERKLVR